MFDLAPHIPTKREDYEIELWTKEECFRYYVEQRRIHCTYLQILDLWLLAPYCNECSVADPFIDTTRLPDLTEHTWKLDVLMELGPIMLEVIEQNLEEDDAYSFLCKHCSKELRPWNGDEVYIAKIHLEEYYRIPLGTPGKVQPSKEIQKQIKSLYGNSCFNCGTAETPLHIDHVRPRTKGGDCAFRNLQPLCTTCGNSKGDIEPEEIEVSSTMYFELHPSDSYEGMFW